jgi:hypothetical protein
MSVAVSIPEPRRRYSSHSPSVGINAIYVDVLFEVFHVVPNGSVADADKCGTCSDAAPVPEGLNGEPEDWCGFQIRDKPPTPVLLAHSVTSRVFHPARDRIRGGAQ